MEERKDGVTTRFLIGFPTKDNKGWNIHRCGETQEGQEIATIKKVDKKFWGNNTVHVLKDLTVSDLTDLLSLTTFLCERNAEE